MTTTGTTTTTGTGRAGLSERHAAGDPAVHVPGPGGLGRRSPSLDTLAVAGVPVADDGFWASIIVTANRVPSGLKLRQAVETTYLQFLVATPTPSCRASVSPPTTTRETYVRVVEVTGDDGPRRVAAGRVLLRAAPGESTASASCSSSSRSAPTEHQDSYGRAVVDALAGFRFT